jgi:hypothetical protein
LRIARCFPIIEEMALALVSTLQIVGITWLWRRNNERNPTVSLKDVQAKSSFGGAVQKYSGPSGPIPVFLLTSSKHALNIAPQW